MLLLGVKGYFWLKKTGLVTNKLRTNNVNIEKQNLMKKQKSIYQPFVQIPICIYEKKCLKYFAVKKVGVEHSPVLKTRGGGQQN